MTRAQQSWRSGLALAALALLLAASIWIPTRLVVTDAPLYSLLFLWSASLLAAALGCRSAFLMLIWAMVSAWAAWSYAADTWLARDIITVNRFCLWLAGALGVLLAAIEIAARRGAGWISPIWLRWALALAAAGLLLRIIIDATDNPTLFGAPMIALAVAGLAGLTWFYGAKPAWRPAAPGGLNRSSAAGPDHVMMALSLCLGVLAFAGQAWHGYHLMTAGRLVLLPLAVEDVQMLAQGDWLRPVPAASALPPSGLAMALPPTGRMILAVDQQGVGRFVRPGNGPQPGPGEHFIHYRMIDQNRSRPSMIYGPQWAPLNAAERAQLEDAAYAVYRLNNTGLVAWAGLADQAGRLLSGDARAYPLAALQRDRAQAAWR